MPTSLWFVVNSHRFRGCQSTTLSPPLDPRRIEAEEVFRAQDPQICEHERMSGPAQLVAADRLKIFGLRSGDADRVRDKPRLIHATGNCVLVGFEERDSPTAEHVSARYVRSY